MATRSFMSGMLAPTSIRPPFRALTLVALFLLLFLFGCFHGGNSPARTGVVSIGDRSSISPDGKTIVFSSTRSGNGDIVRINRDCTGRVVLAGSRDEEEDPVYSPDGKNITYVLKIHGYHHIWIMNADGTDQKPLTSGFVDDELVDFSPDGSSILFGRVTVGALAKSLESMVMKIDGSEVRPWHDRLIEQGQFSGDGIWKVQEESEEVGGTRRIYHSRLDGSGRKRVCFGSNPLLTRDGKRVFYLSNPYSAELRVVDTDGKNNQSVSLPRGYKYAPRRSADGRFLAVSVILQSDATTSIFIVDTGTCKVIATYNDMPNESSKVR